MPFISVVANCHDSHPVREDVPWPLLVKRLTEHRPCGCTLATCPQQQKPKGVCPEKDGEGWCACTFTGDHRKKDKVEQVTAAVFDIDHQPVAEVDALLDRLVAAGLGFVFHTSHSHTDADFCARLVFPLERPITAAEWATVREHMIAAHGIPADPATKDPSRLFFFPSAPADARVIGFEQSGSALPVSVILQGPRRAPPKTLAAPAEVPNPRSGTVTNLDELWKLVKGIGPEGERLAKGEPLCAEGERDSTLQSVMSRLAFTLPETTPIDLILEMVRPSVLALPGAPPPGASDWMGEAEKKLLRALQDCATKRTAARAFREDLSARLRARAAAADDPVQEAEGDAPLIEEDLGDGPGTYSEEQIAKWAAEQGCDPAEMEGRWIITNGKTAWVFAGGKYLSPVLKDELAVSLLRDLSRAPNVSLTIETKTGIRFLTPPEILRQYSTVARKVSASLSLQKSHYDAKTQTFHEAVCPLRPLTPKRDDRIQEWLEMIGGDQADLLLDWVATYTDLSKQTCCIYLCSGPGAGKTLLAQGLARVWTREGPTQLESVVGTFNDALTKCPLVFADEALPSVGKGLTTMLRRLLGTSTRSLSRKFMNEASLEGAVRLIIAANNERLLETGEELTRADLVAVAGRFLFLDTSRPEVSEPISKFLLQVGKKVVNDEWLFGDGIARHALWLRDNRKVESPGRFLVEGKQTDFHRSLVTASGITASVAEWIVKYLNEKAPINRDTVQVGSGRIWVATEAVGGKELWQRLVPSMDVPSATRIGRALSNLSQGSVRAMIGGRQLVFHDLQTEVVFSWAEKNQLGDPQRLRDLLAKPNPEIEKVIRRREEMGVQVLH